MLVPHSTPEILMLERNKYVAGFSQNERKVKKNA